MKAKLIKKSGLQASMKPVIAGTRLADMITSDGDHIRIHEAGVSKLTCKLAIYKDKEVENG